MNIFYSLLLGFGSMLYVLYAIHLFRIGHTQPLFWHALMAIALILIILIRHKRNSEHR